MEYCYRHGFDPYVDLLSLMRGGTPLRRLLAQRGRIAAVTFALDTTPHSSIHQLGRILRQLDIHVLRFSHSRQWIPPEKMEDILQLTPSLQHLELCASAPSLAIDSAPFLDVAERHAPHLTTLILRNVPTSFGRLSSQILRNLEVRTNINQPQSNTERVLAFCQLLERTPSLERLVLHDMTPSEDSWWPDPSSWGFERVAGESYLMALARRSPRLLRLRVFHLRTSNYVEASAYLGLLSRSNLTELSVWLGKRYSFPTYTYWNIEQLRVWPQLRVLSLPVLSLAPPNGMNLVRLFKELTGLEDLEWDRDNFLDLVTLAFDETAILPSLKTLRLRSKGTVRHANASIGRFLRARDNAGLPVERLLIHGDGVTDFFRHERELQAIRVLIGGYRHRDGFEGANAALEPVDVLFSEAVLKKYGLWGEQSQKAKQSQNDGRGVGRSRPVQE
ncbi:hypothetical protein CALVIDRAFT_68180 [Calocera viscosa TUFC12733]|uniref:F-box domain-containing protein n=1 Tax=Calocera viscosa (strain TUFC12733) TaxID=1330018 RepID=A0A167N8Q1_CALVF|nr:hypothetical protein CALVIDRAFT_68180 [Calocera viscosa TUFC12733]